MALKLGPHSVCQILGFQRKSCAGNLVLHCVTDGKCSSGNGDVAAGHLEMKGLFCVSFRDFSLFIGVCYPVAGVMGLRRKCCLSEIAVVWGE